jgi:N,N-dimethylformamidase
VLAIRGRVERIALVGLPDRAIPLSEVLLSRDPPGMTGKNVRSQHVLDATTGQLVHLIESSVVSAALPITGYVDRFSRRPGQVIGVHVSVRDGGKYRVRLVRVVSADANPRGPGVRFDDLSHFLDETYVGCDYPVRLGSYVEAPAPPLDRQGRDRYTWTALIRPGLLAERTQVVLSHECDCSRVTLSIDHSGVSACITAEAGEIHFDVPKNLSVTHWYRVWTSVDMGAGTAIVGVQEIHAPAESASTASCDIPAMRLPSGGHITVAARHRASLHEHFEGKIEDPAVLDGWWTSWDDPRISLSDLGVNVRAAWDFSVGISGRSIFDVGSRSLHGTAYNSPARGVRGARWCGREFCWVQRPKEYAAIHFHSDDLEDCNWPLAFEFVVPPGLRSGSYALHLSCAQGEDWVPFYVLPRQAGPYARLAFLAPTFTYQAYANLAYDSKEYCDKIRNRAQAWGAYPYFSNDYPMYGKSTYNTHPDGSGVAYSTRLRPILSMRPAAISISDEKGSGLRDYPADALILAWLDDRGFDYDVITDEDLHEEGVEILKPYAAVLTGSHPEYHSMQTLDALQGYLRCGGRLIYCGGNGFYWRIARSESSPHTIEVRRAEGGVRSWAADPGEYYHSSDGELGGLWCRLGRTPQALVGVGFSAQGPFTGTYYLRTPESHDERWSWIFDGIQSNVIGDYGLSGGAAAGFELDRADRRLGTPSDAVVLARTVSVPDGFYPVLEEILWGSVTTSGEASSNILRSDMVAYETPFGGAVFSVGSITFSGSLWRDGFEGPICRLLENVVRRFGSGDKPTGLHPGPKVTRE